MQKVYVLKREEHSRSYGRGSVIGVFSIYSFEKARKALEDAAKKIMERDKYATIDTDDKIYMVIRSINTTYELKIMDFVVKE